MKGGTRGLDSRWTQESSGQAMLLVLYQRAMLTLFTFGQEEEEDGSAGGGWSRSGDQSSEDEQNESSQSTKVPLLEPEPREPREPSQTQTWSCVNSCQGYFGMKLLV